MLLEFAPMLADQGSPRVDLAGWAAEPKLDRWRAIVVLAGAGRAGDFYGLLPHLVGGRRHAGPPAAVAGWHRP